jgi:hypothetical protein
MASYTFDKQFVTNAAGAVVAIDTAACYGYWERADGTEGGGLWFTGLELTDYDGAGELPQRVVQCLRDAGYILDETFNP